MSSFEILPPFEKDGRQQIIGISLNEGYGTIRLTHHTIAVGETDKEKVRSPTDFQEITIPIEHLKWIGPRLEGLRQHFKIESGYELHKSNT